MAGLLRYAMAELLPLNDRVVGEYVSVAPGKINLPVIG